MSFSFTSRSSSGRYHRNGHYGSRHYQKKSILGRILNIITSRSCSSGRYRNHYNNRPIYNEPTRNQNAIICSNCNSQIPSGSKFCLECGQKVNYPLFCMNCGEKLPPNAKFCLKCGNKVSS